MLNLVPEKRPWPRLLVFPLLTLALVALGLARLFPNLVYRLAHCPLRDTTGIPCLTCGGTHTLVALTNGRWTEALTANPLVALGTVAFLLWSGYAIVSTIAPGLRRSLELPPHAKRAVRIVAALFLLGTWAWEYWQFR